VFHLNSFQHLVEIKFGDGFIELLLSLHSLEELSSLHPERDRQGYRGRQTDRKRERETDTLYVT